MTRLQWILAIAAGAASLLAAATATSCAIFKPVGKKRKSNPYFSECLPFNCDSAAAY